MKTLELELAQSGNGDRGSGAIPETAVGGAWEDRFSEAQLQAIITRSRAEFGQHVQLPEARKPHTNAVNLDLGMAALHSFQPSVLNRIEELFPQMYNG
jgi:hypothetical protein